MNSIQFGVFYVIDGKIIRHLRQQRKLSLAELSSMSGLSVSYISEIERGVKQPSLDTVDKLAKALNVSREALFSDFHADISSPGEMISYLRKQEGLTLTGLAEKAGISGTLPVSNRRGKGPAGAVYFKGYRRGFREKTRGSHAHLSPHGL